VGRVADLTGTYELGPQQGRVLVETGRQGLAALAGHDLTLEITQWSARVTVPSADETSATETLTAELDLGSLEVRDGRGGAKPLSDRDRRDIQNQARKILGSPATARFTSTRVVRSASEAGSGAIEGTLALNGVTKSIRLEVTSPSPGQYRGSGAIRQTDFGITPYSGFFGALKLADEVQVDFQVALQEIPNGSGLP
jgi:polyisoprenoid-binding protein YceI